MHGTLRRYRFERGWGCIFGVVTHIISRLCFPPVASNSFMNAFIRIFGQMFHDSCTFENLFRYPLKKLNYFLIPIPGFYFFSPWETKEKIRKTMCWNTSFRCGRSRPVLKCMEGSFFFSFLFITPTTWLGNRKRVAASGSGGCLCILLFEITRDPGVMEHRTWSWEKMFLAH